MPGSTCIIVLLSLLGGGVSGAVPELQRLLTLPISAGSIAALVPHAADPAAQARLAAGLRDPRPDVRGIAARVVFITRSVMLLPTLAAVLAGEPDDDVAAELIRALGTFDGVQRFEPLQQVALSRGTAVQAAFTEALARTSPERLATWLQSGASLDLRVRAQALLLASAQHAAARETLARAAVRGGTGLWAAYLSGMRESGMKVDGRVLKEAVRADDEHVRSASAFHLVVMAGHPGAPLDHDALVAAADRAEGQPPAMPTWDVAYGELARRALGRPSRPVSWATLLAADALARRPARFERLNASLLGSERNDVERLVGQSLPGDEYFRTAAAADHPESRRYKTRTLSPAVARLLPGLMRVFGCEAQDAKAFAAAEVFYRPDGRPRVVTPAESHLDEPCTAAAHAAFLLTVPSAWQPVGTDTSDGVFLPFERAYLSCVDQPLEAPVAESDAVDWTPPRPPAAFRPEYPKRLRRLGLAGPVRVEVLVSSRGCARAAETLSSLHPLLDVELIRAVLNARYQPATAGGRPVAASMQTQVWFRP